MKSITVDKGHVKTSSTQQCCSQSGMATFTTMSRIIAGSCLLEGWATSKSETVEDADMCR